MIVIGDLPPEQAADFVSKNPDAQLHSKSSRGTIRIATSAIGDDLRRLSGLIPGYAGATPREIPESTRPECRHLGGKRHCCASLYLCKKHPGESCSPAGAGSGVLNCQTCPLWESKSE